LDLFPLWLCDYLLFSFLLYFCYFLFYGEPVSFVVWVLLKLLQPVLDLEQTLLGHELDGDLEYFLSELFQFLSLSQFVIDLHYFLIILFCCDCTRIPLGLSLLLLLVQLVHHLVQIALIK